MKNVIIDINSKPSTIYYIGSTGDDKAYSLSFLNLPLDGTEYAITWQNNEETLKLQPLNNNEFIVTNKYTKTAGIINIQLYSKKDDEWIAYSGILRLMLTESIKEETPEPTPTPTDVPEYVIYKAYDENAYSLNGLGPCVVQNEKTDVNIKIDGNDLKEIHCLGGQYTLIKKIDGTDGIIGYFTDNHGICNYLEVRNGLIITSFADGDKHWGLLSVSADNKTLTAVDFVNGLKTDKEATENNDVVNKGYVDSKIPSTPSGSSIKRIVGTWKEGIINGYNHGLARQAGYKGLLYEVDLSDYVGKTVFYNCSPCKTQNTNNAGISSGSSGIYLYDFKNTSMFYDSPFDGTSKNATQYPFGNYPHYIDESNNRAITGSLNITNDSKIFGYNINIQGEQNAITSGWIDSNGNVNPRGVDVIFTIMEVQ